ncbi:acyltransferase family protein [Granulicella sibirica]|nr:acyltransferase [Granulicella sibirica]
MPGLSSSSADSAGSDRLSKPSIPRFYRPELDALRAFAFILVFNHHILGAPIDSTFRISSVIQESGAAGVCIFFMLSSFLITELLLREKERTGTIHIKNFYIRRVLRIQPLYLLAVGIAFFLPHVLHTGTFIGNQLAPYLLLCGNWATAAHGWARNPGLEPLWSISVEEQFYLIWPALALYRGKKGMIYASLFVLPVAWAVDYLLPMSGVAKSPALWVNSVSQFQFFVIGALLAIYLHHRSYRLATGLRIVAFISGMMLLAFAAFPLNFIDVKIPSTPMQVLLGYLCLDAGCLLIFFSVLGAEVPLIARPLIYLGKISYGLYIFHMLVRSVVGEAIGRVTHSVGHHQLLPFYLLTAAGSIVIAAASYRFYEKPFLRLKDRFTFVPSRAA